MTTPFFSVITVSTLGLFFCASIFAVATHFLANAFKFCWSSFPNAAVLTFEYPPPGFFCLLNPPFSLASLIFLVIAFNCLSTISSEKV